LVILAVVIFFTTSNAFPRVWATVKIVFAGIGIEVAVTAVVGIDPTTGLALSVVAVLTRGAIFVLRRVGAARSFVHGVRSYVYIARVRNIHVPRVGRWANTQTSVVTNKRCRAVAFEARVVGWRSIAVAGLEPS